MRLFDTGSRRLEKLRLQPQRPFGLYVCGITPYDTTHLGHAFTYVVYDVLARHLQTVHRRHVRYCQNVTDIDDDVLRRAQETGEDWRGLGRRWTERFRADLGLMGLRAPDIFAGATAHIEPILEAVEGLLALGFAYESGGSVYFDVTSDPHFGSLADQPYAEQLALANERGNNPEDPAKRDPLDFVLWQRGAPTEPAWTSPWGPGRPGWHIECSTLASLHLDVPIDVHGGGTDLIFPHHAAEIAQAEPLTGCRPWVRTWMHVAMVRKDGEKMSKSLGNLVLLEELLREFQPDTVRAYLLRHHYREEWSWDQAVLRDTEAWIRTLHAAVRRESGSGRELDFASYGPAFTRALDDDLDTPTALSTVLKLADDILEAPHGADVRGAQDVLRMTAGDVLGLWLCPLSEVPDAAKAPWPAPTEAPADLVIPAPQSGASLEIKQP